MPVMLASRIELLQRMPIFGGLREDILKFLLDLSRVVELRGNDFFFRENDEADAMFVLEVGKVAVLKQWRGHQYLLRHLVKGDCFGEMALMDLLPRSASVLAVEDCTAIEISATCLHRVYEKDVEQFAMIEMNMGREVSRRLRESDERLFRASMGAPDFRPEDTFQAT